MRLKNKVAIVTGAARGIGKACADRFAQEGAYVVRADVLQSEGIVPCDIAKEADIGNLVAHALKHHGGIDILVNNAGISIAKDPLEITAEDYDAVMAVNARGPFLLAQACAREMVKQGRGGAIINMSSVNAVLAIPAILPYCMSKGAIKQLTATLAVALAPHNIRVNAIGPGSIDTDMLKGTLADKAALNRALSRTPLGRVGTPAEMAAIATFLASDESSYVTGQTIYADGGRMPLNYTVPVKE